MNEVTISTEEYSGLVRAHAALDLLLGVILECGSLGYDRTFITMDDREVSLMVSLIAPNMWEERLADLIDAADKRMAEADARQKEAQNGNV